MASHKNKQNNDLMYHYTPKLIILKNKK